MIKESWVCFIISIWIHSAFNPHVLFLLALQFWFVSVKAKHFSCFSSRKWIKLSHNCDCIGHNFELWPGTQPLWFPSFRQQRIWPLHVVVSQRMAKKCKKNHNAHAQPLFCSFSLLFSDVPIAVANVAFLNSLILNLDISNPFYLSRILRLLDCALLR